MLAQLPLDDFSRWRDEAIASAKPGVLPVVLDVREPWEVRTASVTPEQFTLVHIPMGSVPGRINELIDNPGKDAPIACLCHHGVRSQQVASYLTQSGFTQVVNLRGGIAAWAQQLDSSIPDY